MISIALVHVYKIAPINSINVNVLQFFEGKFCYFFYYCRIFICMVYKLLHNLGLNSCAYSLQILLFMFVNIQFLGVCPMFKFMMQVVGFVIIFLLYMIYIHLSIRLIPSPHICLHLFIKLIHDLNQLFPQGQGLFGSGFGSLE